MLVLNSYIQVIVYFCLSYAEAILCALINKNRKLYLSVCHVILVYVIFHQLQHFTCPNHSHEFRVDPQLCFLCVSLSRCVCVTLHFKSY